ncbi:methyltransferase domain-containing protein [Chitinophaga lutea]|uniref:Methyltransferase domain-containing protein n=1 Tax=Chitinophaga lutea TaxID=2488634 RepID=A0A3N4PZC8_9BACT|nr:class I SAM-dependent methyltransferase [Chitinophaga lutea]RPE12765.1 methyltransferase domain-containing protein [Chitinophaga lutea]
MMEHIITNGGLHTSNVMFDNLYPETIRRLSKHHWTPVAIARQAAHFLADAPGRRVLDIGSGVGKFCLIGAYFYPEAHFYGVEQRKELYAHAESARTLTQQANVHFIHGNFTALDFEDYDNFYFYNAFFENLDEGNRIDHQIEFSESLFVYYSQYLYTVLDHKPAGTRLVTFHSLENEVPPRYEVRGASADRLLKMWEKV